MNNLIEITDDLFDISRRLKSVDEDYRLYYNGAKRRYEVHNRKQCGSTLAFVVPFEELDARTVEYARKTRAENIEFASTVGCVCNFKNKLYVFADGVYTLAPDLDEAYFIVTKVCESSPDVTFATAVCDKLYCATSDGMMVYDGGKFSKLSLSVGSLGTIQMLSAQNGQLVIADNKQTIFYNPTTATAEVYGFAATSAAITATEAVLSDGNGIATLQTNADGGSWYGTFDFGYAATKCLRKAVIVGKGKSVITVESNGRYVTVDFDGDGSAATVSCYIVGRQFDVTAKLLAGASVQSVGFVGVVFDEEVKL